MSRYIDADGLKEKIYIVTKSYLSINYFTDTKYIEHYIRLIANALKAEPTADVRENVRGEWKVLSDDIGDFRKAGYRWVKCNKCTNQVKIRLDSPLYDFCPNCGADMRGEEE